MSVYDKIAASLPINTQAAMTTASGRDVKSAKKITTADSQIPLPTIKVPTGCADLSGVTFGRFKVVGKSDQRIGKHGKWVVRCACSVFSIRKAKAILNPSNTEDRCEECRHNAYLRRTSQFRALGKNTSSEAAQ